MLAIDDWVSSEDDGYDDDDMDVASSTIGNYALVEDLFFVLMWINLSVIMLMSMALIPVLERFLEFGSIEYPECAFNCSSVDIFNHHVCEST